MNRLHVLSVASEMYPLVKTGGLADVVGALPAALAREGIATHTLIPGYPAVIGALRDAATVHRFSRLQNGAAKLLRAHINGLDILVLDAPHLFARPGNPYLGPDGNEWPDNAFRFAALAQCAVQIARGGIAGFTPDVVHAHDWQAGLVPALLHYAGGPRPGTVITLHNLAFAGRFPRELLGAIGLPPQAYAIDGVEFHGAISYLKAGLALADRITTVSPTYAAEIQTADGGMGFDGLLRQRAGVLTGILNGIDIDVWNPANDSLLPHLFDARHLGRRAKNKAALQQRFDLTVDPFVFVFGIVSRLTHQKGMDMLVNSLGMITGAGAQVAILGSGDAWLEKSIQNAMRLFPGRVGTVIGYDESLAHLIQGGVDALVVPSRFEPCGLTQLCALRYGAIPIVSRVGGLADTVIDANEMALAAGVCTGVQFAPVTPTRLELALSRALALRGDGASWRWRRMQSRAMSTDVSWTRPAKQYAQLFDDLVARRAPNRAADERASEATGSATSNAARNAD